MRGGSRDILGHRRLDVLDTVHNEGPLTENRVVYWTGSDIEAVRKALSGLAAAKLIRKNRRTGAYRITTEGEKRLRAEIDAGAVPGVPSTEVRRMGATR